MNNNFEKQNRKYKRILKRLKQLVVEINLATLSLKN